MPIKTKRWNDPVKKSDGFRLLICRYRPRGVPKADEKWHAWYKELGPSKELHAAVYGKNGPPITWDEYRRRYMEEMRGEEQQKHIRDLAALDAEGKSITLLCSSACKNKSKCHRTLLLELIRAQQALTAGA